MKRCWLMLSVVLALGSVALASPPIALVPFEYEGLEATGATDGDGDGFIQVVPNEADAYNAGTYTKKVYYGVGTGTWREYEWVVADGYPPQWVVHGRATADGGDGVLWFDSSTPQQVGTITLIGESSPDLPPVAVAVVTPTSGMVVLMVSGDGSGSTDEDGTIVSYHWDWGDGSTSSTSSAANSYEEAGEYTVVLTVTDNDGLTDTDSVVVTVEPDPENLPNVDPTCAISVSPATGDAPLTVTGSAGGSADEDGTIVSYAWSWGDGGTGSGVAARHTYTAVGTYTVTLTVTDNDGGTSSCQTDVEVTDPADVPPVAILFVFPAAGEAPLDVDGDGSQSYDPDGTIVSYAWSWGDGGTGTGATDSNQYANDGAYTVTLTVTDDDGLTDTATAVVNVNTLPEPDPQDPDGDMDCCCPELLAAMGRVQGLLGGIQSSINAQTGTLQSIDSQMGVAVGHLAQIAGAETGQLAALVAIEGHTALMVPALDDIERELVELNAAHQAGGKSTAQWLADLHTAVTTPAVQGASGFQGPDAGTGPGSADLGAAEPDADSNLPAGLTEEPDVPESPIIDPYSGDAVPVTAPVWEWSIPLSQLSTTGWAGSGLTEGFSIPAMEDFTIKIDWSFLEEARPALHAACLALVAFFCGRWVWHEVTGSSRNGSE